MASPRQQKKASRICTSGCVISSLASEIASADADFEVILLGSMFHKSTVSVMDFQDETRDEEVVIGKMETVLPLH